MIDWSLLTAWWPKVIGFLNEEFMKALLGSIAGAWAGAFYGAKAAQRIADKKADREQRLVEIRSINGALELLFAIINTYFNLKQQHVIGLKRNYDEQRERVTAHHRRLQAGERLPVIELGQIDLSELDVIRFRTDKIEQLLIEKISSTGRVVPMFAMFLQSAEALNQLIGQRNDLVRQLMRNDINRNVPILFGIPQEGGRIDDRYGQYVHGISQMTDDCIFFAVTLTSELKSHGERVRERYVRHFGNNAPKINQLAFDHAVKSGLMPPEEAYSSWRNSFIRLVPSTEGRHWKKCWYSVRKCLRKPKMAWRRRTSTPSASK